MKTLCVGIDVSQDRHSVSFVNSEDGRPVGKTFTVDNNLPGAEKLVMRIAEEAPNFDEVTVGLEPTGVYWLHIRRYLERSPELARFGVRVVAFKPKDIKAFRKVGSTPDKTDSRDSLLIAKRIRAADLPNGTPPDPRYLALQRLTRHRYHLVNTLVRVKCNTLAQLFIVASEYYRLKPFSDPFGPTSMAVLTEFKTLDELAAIPVDELIELIVTHGRNRFDEPAKIAATLKQIAASSFRLDQTTAEPIHTALRSALEVVKLLIHQIKQLDLAIANEMQAFPNTLRSVKGLGPVLEAGIVAEIAGIDRFKNDASLARYAGLSWPRNQSGKFDAEDKHLSKEGNAFLRYYLCEAADSVRHNTEEYAEYYNRKHKESSTHAHKRATVLTARKLVRLVHALLRTNQNYNPSAAVSPSTTRR